MRIRLITLLITFICGTLNAAPVAIGFRLDDATLLPGTSSNALIIVTNSASRSVTLTNGVLFEASRDGGEAFVLEYSRLTSNSPYRPIPAEFFGGDDGETDRSPSTVTVPAKSQFAFSYPFLGPTPFADERLSSPGTYRLRVAMRFASGEQIWSPSFVLYVKEPTGEDALVWQRMKELAPGKGWTWGDWYTTGFREEVWQKFRTSGYAPYVTGSSFAALADKSERREIGSKGPFRDYIRFEEAEELGREFLRALMARDRSGALTASRQKKGILEELLGTTTDAFLKAKINYRLSHSATPDEINEVLEKLAEVDRMPRPTVPKIEPRVDCVKPSANGEWIAFFGYTSEFTYEYRLDLATGQNKFEPKPHVRGQISKFKPGGEARAFAVTFDGEPLTWFLRDEKATASKNSPRCAE
jgi:hypothetical protein